MNERILAFQAACDCGERIAMLTAYDYPTARILDDAGIPMLLVGDSLGQVILGYDSTVRVTMTEILHHTKAVVRGTRRSLVVADMPFLSYGVTPEASLENAGILMREGGAGAVSYTHLTLPTKRIV